MVLLTRSFSNHYADTGMMILLSRLIGSEEILMPESVLFFLGCGRDKTILNSEGSLAKTERSSKRKSLKRRQIKKVHDRLVHYKNLITAVKQILKSFQFHLRDSL